MQSNPVLLQPFAQNYDWGKVGRGSKVAQLLTAGYQTAIAPEKPYAELWMGDHPNGPCYIVSGESFTPIAEYLRNESTGGIKFLFKVLSVKKALSIQSHPDELLARELHSKFPEIYKDPNPKPELAIAMTDFRALFGFRPLHEITLLFDAISPLSNVIPRIVQRDLQLAATNSGRRDALKAAYTCLMRSSNEIVRKTIHEVTSFQIDGTSSSKVSEAIMLARELDSQFPGGDVGVLSVFFLNIVALRPGECLFMGANVPHAYLSGDILECMTSSDNVIRGGLTPKFKDVDTLLASLDFTPTTPTFLKPSLIESRFPCWSPPNVPFAVAKYSLHSNSTEVITSSNGPSIGLVMAGSGRIGTLSLTEGQCCLLAPSTKLLMEPMHHVFDVYIAYSP
jgi:mannose-6-phosphate isomerase